jgi:hypothetical protein
LSILFLSQAILCSPCDDHTDTFEVETARVCGAMIKRRDELTEEEPHKQKYRDGKVPLINYETNKNEYL